MGRLAWQKSLDQVDVPALIDGLGHHAELVLRIYDEAAAIGADMPAFRAAIRSYQEDPAWTSSSS